MKIKLLPPIPLMLAPLAVYAAETTPAKPDILFAVGRVIRG